MNKMKEFLELLSEQKVIINKYEQIISEISDDKEINNNKRLEDEVKYLKNKLEELEKDYNEKVSENLRLKDSLNQQTYSYGKTNIEESKSKSQTYFNELKELEKNKLYEIEEVSKNRVDELRGVIEKELEDKSEGLLLKINEIESEIKILVENKKKSFKEDRVKVIGEIREKYENLVVDEKEESTIYDYEKTREKELNKRVFEKKKKDNDMEVKIGLNLINKMGVILILLATATGIKYTYSNFFGVYMKSILVFVLGVGLLGVGELFNKKDKNTFALGLCGGGIGVLYLAVFSSYFILNTIGILTALILSLMVTGISILLAKRYSSQTITAMSLIGGYLPFFTYTFIEGLNSGEIYIAMTYLLILNLIILLVSVEKRWAFVKYLSYGLNALTSIYLVYSLNNDVFSIFYYLLVFGIYISVVLYKPIKEDLKLKDSETILLGINTVINFMFIYSLFNKLGWNDFYGFLALANGIAYYFIGKYISEKSNDLKKTSDLFYLTSMTFAVIMIPLQFGIKWLSLGWLVEAVLLLHFSKSKYKDEKKMENAGWTIFGLCLGAFIIFDYNYTFISNYIFKYSAITASLLYILKLYLPEINENDKMEKEKSNRKILLNIYKYFVVVFSWIFLLRVSFILYNDMIDVTGIYSDFFKPVIFAVITSIYAYIISNIKILKDRNINIISIGMYILVVILGLELNVSTGIIIENTNIRILSIIILIIYNIFNFFGIKSLILKLIEYKKITMEMLPLSMAIYTLLIIPTFLMNQFELSNINLIISIIFVILSFIYIVYGFKENYVFIRRLGLSLSIFATTKLFIFDLVFLSTLGKFVAYLLFGLTLLGISFIYQKLESAMED